MSKLRKIVVMVLVVAVASFGLMGCKDNHEHPAGEHPSKEAPAEEHPAGEQPTEGTPSQEQPQ